MKKVILGILVMGMSFAAIAGTGDTGSAAAPVTRAQKIFDSHFVNRGAEFESKKTELLRNLQAAQNLAAQNLGELRNVRFNTNKVSRFENTEAVFPQIYGLSRTLSCRAMGEEGGMQFACVERATGKKGFIAVWYNPLQADNPSGIFER